MRIIILLALVILIVSIGLTDAGKKGKKGKRRNGEVKEASAEGSFTKAPRKKGRRVEFNTEEDLTVRIKGKKSRKAKLRKAYGGPDNKKLASKNDEQWAVYSDPENNVICRKDCDGTGSCDDYCTVHDEDQSCFIMGDKALCMDNEPETRIDSITVPDLPDSLLINKNRTRRSVAPDFNTVGIVRVIFHYDDAFMLTFQGMANGDATAALDIATMYTKLLANEATISFQTMKEYGQTFTFNGVTRQLDFAIYVAHIEFPPIILNQFINVLWSAAAYDSASNSLVDGLVNFRVFTRAYSAPVAFDLQTAMTGYSLGGPVGVGYFATLCNKNAAKFLGYTTTINRQYGMMARLVAHELGHNFGINHDDGTRCPTGEYVMSPWIVYPESSTKDTFYKFSSCSVSELQNRLDGSNNIYDCLYDTGITDDDYLDQFCQGFRGTGLTLEDNCKAAYGSGSTLCYGGRSGFISSCLPAQSGSYGCTKSDGLCYYINDIPFGTKCSIDGKRGDSICYKGECVSALEICPASSTTAPTTTTTTPTTTTPTTTTAPPTTTTCSCTTSQCCRNAFPSCDCSGCFINGRGRCRLNFNLRTCTTENCCRMSELPCGEGCTDDFNGGCTRA